VRDASRVAKALGPVVRQGGRVLQLERDVTSLAFSPDGASMSNAIEMKFGSR